VGEVHIVLAQKPSSRRRALKGTWARGDWRGFWEVLGGESGDWVREIGIGGFGRRSEGVRSGFSSRRCIFGRGLVEELVD